MKQLILVLIVPCIALKSMAQVWPDFYLTNGMHSTSYGVEAYDPATVKNLYVNPTATLNPASTELGDIYDGNQLILNGGRLITPVIDANDFTWNNGTLVLNGGTHRTTYGLDSGTGKKFNIGVGATVELETINSISAGNHFYLGAGCLSVSNFNASMEGFSFYDTDFFAGNGGTLEVSGVLSGVPSEYWDSGVSVVLNGKAAQWNLNADGIVTMGDSVTVKNGGILMGSAYDWDYNSAITVTGSGSSWNSGYLAMNDSGGRLMISDGAQVQCSNVEIGTDAGSDNEVTVTGGGSIWNTEAIFMGSSIGYGNSLVVSNGARVLSAGSLIGVERSAVNKVVVTGEGSRWILDGNLTLGDGSEGNTLAIENGGYVESDAAHIGKSTFNVWSADGNQVKVTGKGSSWNNAGQIIIGNTVSIDRGNSLVIGSGGTVRAGEGVVLISSFDTLNLNDGGRLEIGTDFDASMVGFNFNESSELAVEGQLSGLSMLESGRRLETPDLLGDFTVHGTFAPGTSPADSTLTGNLTIAVDGTLEMELAGYALGSEYDRLTVTGLASLDGLLGIVSLGGFATTNGATFHLFDFEGGVSGTFSAVSTDALAAGQYWDTSELYTTGQLSVIPEPGSIGLLGLGSGILLFARRHRRWSRGAGRMPVVREQACSCNVFDPLKKAVAIHQRDFWDFLDSCFMLLDRAKATALRIFDAFLALVLK